MYENELLLKSREHHKKVNIGLGDFKQEPIRIGVNEAHKRLRLKDLIVLIRSRPLEAQLPHF